MHQVFKTWYINKLQNKKNTNITVFHKAFFNSASTVMFVNPMAVGMRRTTYIEKWTVLWGLFLGENNRMIHFGSIIYKLRVLMYFYTNWYLWRFFFLTKCLLVKPPYFTFKLYRNWNGNTWSCMNQYNVPFCSRNGLFFSLSNGIELFLSFPHHL